MRTQENKKTKHQRWQALYKRKESMITLISGGKTERREICHRWREKGNSQIVHHHLTIIYGLSRQIRITRAFSYKVSLQPFINTYQSKKSGVVLEAEKGELEEICQSTPNFQPTKSGSGTGGLSKSLPGIPSLHRELGDYPTKDKWRNNKTTMLKNSYKSNESWRWD